MGGLILAWAVAVVSGRPPDADRADSAAPQETPPHVPPPLRPFAPSPRSPLRDKPSPSFHSRNRGTLTDHGGDYRRIVRGSSHAKGRQDQPQDTRGELFTRVPSSRLFLISATHTHFKVATIADGAALVRLFVLKIWNVHIYTHIYIYI